MTPWAGIKTSEVLTKEDLEWAWKIADELDSNHARWVIGELAKRLGITITLPPINEPNNRLREQLAACTTEIERLEKLLNEHECWDRNNFIKRGVDY